MSGTDRPRTILMIEDERFLQRTTEASLCARGLAVLTAADGETGLQLARRESPDLIILDIMLPQLTGMEVLRALRADERTRMLPVLIVSNVISSAELEEARSLGIAGALVKARVTLQEMANEVSRLVGLR